MDAENKILFLKAVPFDTIRSVFDLMITTNNLNI